jgi:CubicO group peptidase (beta-lactamase class C family)
MNHPTLAAWSFAAFAAGAMHTTSTSAGDTADLGLAIEAALPRLDAIAENLVATGAIPGLSIAIVHDDEIVYLKGFGVRQVGGTDRVSADTVFPLASVSKSISATVVAALVGDGVVSWDTRIATLDPSFRLYDPYVTGEVTIRDLFAHRSGLSGDAGNDLELIGYDRLEILERLHLLEPIAGFRETFSYSNFGITAAALTAALPTGQPWEEIAEERRTTHPSTP